MSMPNGALVGATHPPGFAISIDSRTSGDLALAMYETRCRRRTSIIGELSFIRFLLVLV
jgi:hypothetical protein